MHRAVVAVASAVLLWAGGVDGQEPPPPPLAVTSFTYAPKPAATGDEITVTATLKNTTARLLLANVRLHLPKQVELILPDREQIVFLEPGVSKELRWKAKVVGEGPWRLNVEPSVVSEGRPMNGPQPRISEPMAMALAKTWTGTWTSPAGYVYDATFRARVDASGAVEGRLEWTLRKAPESRTDYADKIGATGTEFVWGTFDSTSRNLDMEGYRRDDPRTVLGLDRYRLTLSEDLTEIKGATWNHGTWKAAFRLTAP